VKTDPELIKILLIEDNPGDAELIEDMLRGPDARFELKCVERLSSGIVQINEDGFDIILLDLGLPDSTGLDTLLKLNAFRPKAPVIVLTGLADETVGTQAVKAGAQDYLIKGQITGNILVRAIRYAVERRLAAAALKESFEKYQTLIETTSTGYLVIDARGRVLDANREYVRLTGYEMLSEILGRPVTDWTAEWDLERNSREVMECLEQGCVRNLEIDYQGKNGAVTPIEINATVLQTPEGTNILTLCRDITERRKAQEALKKSEEFNRSILESVDEGFIVIDRDYRIISANMAFTKQTGLELGVMIGKNCFEVSHHCDAPCYKEGEMCAVKRVFDTGESHTVIHTHYDLKGEPCYVETKAYPLTKDESGRVRTVIEILVDITERKKSEEELKKLSHQISLILNSTGEGIYGVDMNGQVTFINPAGARMLGYKVDELLGRQSHATWHHHYPDGTILPVEECGLYEVLKEGAPGSAENVVFWKKDGTKLQVEYTSTPMLEADKLIGAVVTFRDMSGQLLEEQERRKLEEQLRHSQKMEAVGTLAGGVAHDFNNILNVIIGYGTILLDRLRDDHLSREQLTEVLAAADKAANLTKRLLAFSRKQVVEMRPVSVNEIIAGMEKMLSRIIGEDISFTMELAPGKILTMADSGQLEQVLMNLVSNARDAMPNGGRLKISTEIMEMDEDYIATHGYGKTGPYALISVTDTGGGMDEETQKKIFEPFFTTKGIGEGTGLGLAIAYGIVKQHDGYVQVYSKEGEGTRLNILLPLIEEAAAVRPEVESTGSLKGGTEAILLAEDDGSLRKLSRIVLESFGYTVIAAENGEEAIDRFMENRDKIRLAILDMIMPGKSGREVCEAIKKESPLIKILFISGYTMDLIHREELRDQDVDFILKPISPKDLVKKVREALDG